MLRQIVLDTETTGLDPARGHRIIELGCVELINRRPSGKDFHHYLQPDRAIDPDAVRVHGISNEFLADKPRFSEIASQFIDYIQGAELIIHNAPFDLGFLDHELYLWQKISERMRDLCQVLDTLVLARQRYPGQKNSLDALCKRLNIDNTKRTQHGALLDARILADVYLAMTREQVALTLAGNNDDTMSTTGQATVSTHSYQSRPGLHVQRPTPEELAAHQLYLEILDKSSGGQCLWKGSLGI